MGDLLVVQDPERDAVAAELHRRSNGDRGHAIRLISHLSTGRGHDEEAGVLLASGGTSEELFQAREEPTTTSARVCSWSGHGTPPGRVPHSQSATPMGP